MEVCNCLTCIYFGTSEEHVNVSKENEESDTEEKNEELD